MTSGVDLVPDGWRIAHTTQLPGRPAETVGTADLPLTGATSRYLAESFPSGIYRHQHEAIRRVLSGEDVCLSTTTASGKTLAFTAAALQLLEAEPGARVLAIYPQRALGSEQERRWRTAIETAGLDAGVCRIDGSVKVASRPSLLRSSRIVVMTPDVVHAWLLSHNNDAAVRAFLRGLRLVVVDEVHTYTGVVGSNAAYLFRRLAHCARIAGAAPRFFCASATIRDPETHLEALFGTPFSLIGPDSDTSPRHPVDVYLVRRPEGGDLLTEVAAYLGHLVRETPHRFLSFVDSRKQTEHIATILGRLLAGTASHDAEDESEDEDIDGVDDSILGTAEVLPYRAGYEEKDRQLIQDRLTTGSLRGVVSTSALELGMDIPHLDTAVLLGVPRSSTSLFQRIGRVGRSGRGAIVVISSGDVFDEAVFRAPDQFLRRPPAEGALYLENPRIQYIHALCLARSGGEHDRVAQRGNEADFVSPVRWPDGFLDLCKAERTGQITAELQAMKAEAGDNPNYAFPLRDVEAQFTIERAQGPNRHSMGSMSYGQVLREAYPGAVYYYATIPHRVTSVSTYNRRINVRRDRYYTTRPSKLPTLVFPNLSPGNVHTGIAFDGDLRVLECNLQIRETVNGLKERRGSKEDSYPYPLNGEPSGVRYDGQWFSRNYFTTGALLFHPLLDRHGPDTDLLSALIFEALLMVAPYERQDVGFSVDKIRADSGQFVKDTRFVGIFDQTYGSLRLSGRLLERPLLRQVLETSVDLVRNEAGATPGATQIAESLFAASLTPTTPIVSGEVAALPEGLDDRPRVIAPGSVGLNINRANAEFDVERVLFNPRLGGLAYVGRHRNARAVDGQTETIRLESLVPIPGVSVLGVYDYDTGEVTEI